MADLVIRNGTVVDGTGTAGRVADVAINGGRIVAVEPSIDERRRPRDRRRRPTRDARLRRHPHPLRRPGDVGPGARPVVAARRHLARDGQLRRRVRARPVRRCRSRLADRVARGRGRHPRHRLGGGSDVGLGELPRLPRRARAPLVLARRGRAGRPRAAARVRDGRAGRRPGRAPDRRRAGRHGADGAGRHRRRRARRHDQSHDAAPHPRRIAARHAPLRGRRAAGARHAVEGGRSGRASRSSPTPTSHPTRSSPPTSSTCCAPSCARPAGRCRSACSSRRASTIGGRRCPPSPRSSPPRATTSRRRWRRGPSACSRGSPRRSTRSPSARRTRTIAALPLRRAGARPGRPRAAQPDPRRARRAAAGGHPRRARQGVPQHLPAERPGRLRARLRTVDRRHRRGQRPSPSGRVVRRPARARRTPTAVRATVQLPRRQPRHGARDADVAAGHVRALRRWRPLRRDLRRLVPDDDGGALGQGPHAR